MDNTICHFEIPAEDLAAARQFYGSLFSWSIEPAPVVGESYLFVRATGTSGAVAGGLLRRTPTQPGVTLYFTVADVDESARKVEELGGKVMIPKTAVPKIGWAVVVSDPAGNCLGLLQEDSSAA